MIIRRRTWLYRLHGEVVIQSISFPMPLTMAQARAALRRTVGLPHELWGRSFSDKGNTGT
ncbi:MAG TPA: hypothetical protein VNZ68_11270 [Rhodocyclaceae bacterium]|nr:hypothetical protein [Rhodocyclaceae bacterium]